MYFNINFKINKRIIYYIKKKLFNILNIIVNNIIIYICEY